MNAMESTDPREGTRHWGGGHWKAWLCWAPGVLGLLLLVIDSVWPGDAPPAFLTLPAVVIPLGLVGCYTISIVLHESAHLLMARWVGLRVWCMSVGHGRVIFDKEFAAGRLVVREIPFSGAVYPFSFTSESDRIRWKQVLVSAAGPLSNALLLAGFGLALCNGGLLVASSRVSARMFAIQMSVVNALLFLYGTVPYRLTDGAKNQNDGAAILGYLFSRRPDKREDTSTKAAAAWYGTGPSWRWLRTHVPAETLLAQYRDRLNDTALSSETRCQYLDGFATAVLIYGSTSFLEEADRYSEELAKAMPDSWSVKGTRGSILIDKGDIDPGMAILQEVVKQDPSASDRGIAASFLALAEFKRHHRDAALEWIGTARRVDPNCGALPRVEAIMSCRTGH